MSRSNDIPSGEPALELSYQGVFNARDGVLSCGHNAGFFSNCTVTLWNVSELWQRQRRVPTRLDFSRAFSSYRNEAQIVARVDLYPLFFSPGPLPLTDRGARMPRINHHGLYGLINYAAYAHCVEAFFQPSAAALDWQRRLVDRYRIVPERTIAVVYRGTDKGREVGLADPQHYLRSAVALLNKHPDFRVWIQTDERRVRQMFVDALKDRCFYLEEMPVSDSGEVVHDLDDRALRLDRSEFGILLVAVTHLLSKSAYVVNHTGNMALWVCLYRGHARGVIQFDEAGGLVDRFSPGFYLHRLRLLWAKLARKLARR